jgi:3-oxoacyl-[acyl-carrier protein] reductase
VNYHANEGAARQSANAVEEAGARAIVVQADVADADAAKRMVSEVEDKLGPVDLLVNNAGIFDVEPHTDVTAESWQRTIDCNLTGTFYVTWAVKDGMIERGYGRIVNVTSVAAVDPRPHAIAYAVSKAGMVALTQSLSRAIAAHGVRVNAVAPGLIDTEILCDSDQSLLDTIIAATPMGRIGQPDEVADTVLFLLSDLSRFSTGQTLVCSGGRVLLP